MWLPANIAAVCAFVLFGVSLVVHGRFPGVASPSREAACVFTLLNCSAGADEERLASDVVPVSSSLGGSGPTGSSGASSTTVVSNTAAQSALRTTCG